MNNPPPFTSNTRVAIIGAGGIGSFFCRHLARMLDNGQLPFQHKKIHVYDGDAVEKKNLRHQDYSAKTDVGALKAIAMSVRYGFPSRYVMFEKKHCTNYDLFIICADNPGIRQVIFQHCKTFNKAFLDMRSEGKNIAIVTHKASEAFLMGSLGKDPESTKGQSCQLEVDTVNDIIQLGNMVVAPKGLQVLMDMHRENTDSSIKIPPFVMEELNSNLSVVVA